MVEFLDALGPDKHLGFFVIAGRLLLATILGALIGLEREWRDRPAGLKTHMMVCLASAVFTIVSVELVKTPVFSAENVQMDPSRLVEAVTSGVAFLAAGFIVLSRGEVQGITTGAGMWLAGAVGLAAGLGLWAIAVLASIMAMAIFILVHAVKQTVQPSGKGERDDSAIRLNNISIPSEAMRPLPDPCETA